MKIAVVGGGIAGIAAAHKLQDKHQVTLYESSEELGGHAHSVEVEPGQFVDTGVIIFNQGSYPEFIQFLKSLNVYDNCERMEMSFSFTDNETGNSFVFNKRKIPLLASWKIFLQPKIYCICKKFKELGFHYLNF